MTWKSFHHRGEILRTVIATANTRRDGRLPLDVEGVDEVFDGPNDLLGALQLKWHTRLAGHIDLALGSQPLDLEAAVAGAWSDTRDELPGVRLVLDHYRAHPLDDAMAWVTATTTAKERAMLATMSGLAGVDQLQAAPIGARIEERARKMHRLPSPAARDERSFLERLRAALAA